MRVALQTQGQSRQPSVPFVQELKSSGLDLLPLYRHYGLNPTDKNGEQSLSCPFHEDKRPSLSLNSSTGLWRCHACDVGGDLVDFVAKRLSLSKPDAIHQMRRDLGLERLTPRGESGVAPQGGADEAVYPYTDESGEVLFEVVRRTGKRFFQRKADGTWDLQGVRRVLYRLPELLKAPADETVYLCEGERDAETLAALGLVATTNSGGAAGWRDEYAEGLRGRNVVVLEDNDQAGRDRTATLVRSLLPTKGNRIASSVRVVGFSELPEKSDVSDWVSAQRAAGKTELEVLTALAERVGASLESQAEQPARVSQTLTQWMAHPVPETQWLVEDLIPEHGIIGLIAKPKTGKTFFALQIALCIAAGVPLLGMPTVRSRVLYVDEETGRATMQERLTKMLEDERFQGHETAGNLNIATWGGFSLADPERLRAEIEATGAQIVILDSFRRLFPGEENDSKEVSAAFGVLARMRADLGCAFLFIHHSRKNVEGTDWSDAARGSGDFLAASDGMIGLTRRGDGVTTLKTLMRGTPQGLPMTIALNPDTLLLEISSAEDRQTADLEEILLQFPEKSLPLKTVREMLRDKFGMGSRRVKRTLADENLPIGVGKRQIEGADKNQKELYLTSRAPEGEMGQLVRTPVGPSFPPVPTGKPLSGQLVPPLPTPGGVLTDLTDPIAASQMPGQPFRSPATSADPAIRAAWAEMLYN